MHCEIWKNSFEETKMKDWISKAKRQGTLKMTNHTRCPSCGTLHACKQHEWISENWYEGMKRAYEPK